MYPPIICYKLFDTIKYKALEGQAHKRSFVHNKSSQL
jgi:hypothetical protein